MAGASLAGAAATQLLPGAIGKALAIEPARRTGTVEDVEHVVILMQENRSFDHYFGTMRGVRGYGDPRPHIQPNGRPVWYQSPAKVHTGRYQNRDLPADAEYVLPFPVDALRTSEHIAGTDHGWGSGELLWNQGRYDGWVNEKQDVFTMAHLKRSELPYHFALAEAFTVCDAYHCSMPADTAPNRIMLWSGTIDPQNRLGSKPNGPGIGERGGSNGYTWTTYPERLQVKGVSWKLYQGGTGIPGQPTDNFTDNSLEFFARYQVQEGASGPLVEQGVSTHTLKEFSSDVASGQLPQVTWIVPPYQYSEHASASPADGAYYIDLVLEALVANPEVWSKTVLLINYDENDGLFDHVVPPMLPVTNKVGTDGLVSDSLAASLPDEILDFDVWRAGISPSGDSALGKQPAGLGSRVPMIVVSPFSKGGWVCSEVFDHTSVLRFLETRFGVAEPNISDWRRSLCGDLTSAFDFTRPDRMPVTPAVPQPMQSQNQPFSVALPQSLPQQEPGVRPARPLPYRFAVELDDRRDAHSLSLRFVNSGNVGAYFYVYTHNDSPRRYTVAAGDTISDVWDSSLATNAQGQYDLRVTGANGYLGHFTGTTANTAEPRVSVLLPHTGKPQLVLDVSNPATVPRTLHIRNDYSRVAGRTVHLKPGKTTKVTWDTASAYGWYDISVTDEDDPSYLRRFAGHQETGRPSFSDSGPIRAMPSIALQVPASVKGGHSFTATTTVSVPADEPPATNVTASLAAPDGWTVTPHPAVTDSVLLRAGKSATFTWDVTAPVTVGKVNPLTTTVRFDQGGESQTVSDERIVEGIILLVPQSKMSVAYADSQETVGENAPATNVLDGNPGTYWHTQWSGTPAPIPHEIQLDLGGDNNVNCLYYLPRQDNGNGRIAKYEVYTSTDGTNWGSPVATGTWTNTSGEERAGFTPVSAHYVRLRALSEVNGNPWTTAAEINVGLADD